MMQLKRRTAESSIEQERVVVMLSVLIELVYCTVARIRRTGSKGQGTNQNDTHSKRKQANADDFAKGIRTQLKCVFGARNPPKGRLPQGTGEQMTRRLVRIFEKIRSPNFYFFRPSIDQRKHAKLKFLK